jgi:hypothetical protein
MILIGDPVGVPPPEPVPPPLPLVTVALPVLPLGDELPPELELEHAPTSNVVAVQSAANHLRRAAFEFAISVPFR